MAFDKSKFLAPDPAVCRRETVTVAGFGTVSVREVTGDESRQIAERQKKVEAGEIEAIDNAAWIAVLVICDDDGRQVLAESDIPALVKKYPGRVLIDFGNAAAKAGGWMAGDDEKKEPQPS